MASSKRRRVEVEEDSDDDMLFDESSPSLSSSVATEDPELPLKRLHLDDGSTSTSSVSEQTIQHCSLPGHVELSLPTYTAYEIHYEQYHLHRCNECHKNFPSDHYLQLHISEHHNPIIAVKRDRGERTYGCFVEDCDRKCSTAQKRRMHLIDKHNFPKLYDFFVVNNGIDRRTSMLRGQGGKPHRMQREKTAAFAQSAEQETPADSQISSLMSSMSALKFIPRNLKFGRGGSKTFAR